MSRKRADLTHVKSIHNPTKTNFAATLRGCQRQLTHSGLPKCRLPSMATSPCCASFRARRLKKLHFDRQGMPTSTDASAQKIIISATTHTINCIIKRDTNLSVWPNADFFINRTSKILKAYSNSENCPLPDTDNQPSVLWEKASIGRHTHRPGKGTKIRHGGSHTHNPARWPGFFR
jgi:hypothetical protein